MEFVAAPAEKTGALVEVNSQGGAHLWKQMEAVIAQSVAVTGTGTPRKE